MDPTSDDMAAGERQRLDKWLWFARIVKSRTLAAELVAAGKVRLNRQRIDKPSAVVRPGDVLTVAVHSRVRVLKVMAAGDRRRAAPEARLLYEDQTPAPAPSEATIASWPAVAGERDRGAGRPTKRDRRAIDKLTRER
jgi:ribosome-associated heat shock protein Hsp15